MVQTSFDLYDVNEIDDGAEVFEFSGVLTLRWKDPRQAFDPAAEGVEEKVFQGSYQLNEVSTGWYPQVVLINASGLYEKSGAASKISAMTIPVGTARMP